MTYDSKISSSSCLFGFAVLSCYSHPLIYILTKGLKTYDFINQGSTDHAKRQLTVHKLFKQVLESRYQSIAKTCYENVVSQSLSNSFFHARPSNHGLQAAVHLNGF